MSPKAALLQDFGNLMTGVSWRPSRNEGLGQQGADTVGQGTAADRLALGR